jgi:hypothetical protein
MAGVLRVRPEVVAVVAGRSSVSVARDMGLAVHGPGQERGGRVAAAIVLDIPAGRVAIGRGLVRAAAADASAGGSACPISQAGTA